MKNKQNNNFSTFMFIKFIAHSYSFEQTFEYTK